jgi:membrane fusion protein (multidrug efflux system)
VSDFPLLRHRTEVRYLLAIAGVLVVAGGLAGLKFTQISSLIALGKAQAQQGPPPESVATARAAAESWPETLTAVGSVAPAKGVTVASEVAGLVTAIRFDSGARVRRGQVLVELDRSVEVAQLAAARARQELALVSARRSRALIKEGVIAGAKLDSDESALKSANAEVAALRAQIERKTVRAPFAGRLGIRLVNVGQFLSPGTPLTVLQGVESLFVDFTLPQQRLPALAVGLSVRLTVPGRDQALTGTLAAIDPEVDAATRTIKLRATVAPPDPQLRPGMFVNVEVVLPQQEPRVVIPATAVVHAAYGDSVFVVTPAAAEQRPPAAGREGPPPRVARQQFVRLGPYRGDFVAVLEGVTAGQEVVVAGAFKLRNGGRVVVRNDVTPDAQLAPTPANH